MGISIESYEIKYYIQNEKIVTAFSSSSRLKENAKVFDNGDVGIWKFL